MTTVFFVLFAICCVVLAGAETLKKLGERWKELPHFVYNYVLGIWAVCSITDYRQASVWSFQIPGSGELHALKAVPQTFAFFHCGSWGGRTHLWGNTNSNNPIKRTEFHRAMEASDLFVPFASEAYMSNSAQREFFIPAKADIGKFVAAKKAENCRYDFRLRVAGWVEQGKLKPWILVSALLSVVMEIAWICALGLALRHRADVKPVVVHVTTENGAVQKIVTTGNRAPELLMRESVGNGRYIVRGVVAAIQNLGGGVSRVCAQRTIEHMRCGFAAQSLGIKVGDAGYLRDGELLWWSDDPKIPGAGHIVVDSWFITKGEADALIATGQFKIIE